MLLVMISICQWFAIVAYGLNADETSFDFIVTYIIDGYDSSWQLQHKYSNTIDRNVVFLRQTGFIMQASIDKWLY